MRKLIRNLLPVGLVIIAILIVVVLVNVNKGKRPERKDEASTALLVETIAAEVQSLNFIVRSQGTVRPRTETALVSEVSGKVVWVSPDFVAGGFFRSGQELLRIDPSDYETALKRAEAALASRQARLADEQARSEQALRDWRNLGRSGEPSPLVLRKPQLQDAEANVIAAQADVQQAKRDLQRARITVPYDGLVRQKLVDIGQYVTPGTRLGVSFAVDTAEVRLPLSKDDVRYLTLPSAQETDEAAFPEATLKSVEAGQTRSWQARIIRTEGVVDETSRVIYAVAQVIDPYALLGQSTQEVLQIGTFVSAEIEGIAAENVIVLPRYVLHANDTVQVVNENDELEIRTVDIVRAEPHLVYLAGGVAAGERVVTTTLEAPIPGMKLTVRDQTAVPEAPQAADGEISESGTQP
jgi:RND family efflux transporter MFP subunit